MTGAIDNLPSSARRYALAFVAVFVLHLGLVVYALPAADLFGDRPYAAPDYQTHFRQTTTLTRVVDRFGKLWAYDPGMLAGHPVGLIFDVDNKFHFLFAYGLHKAGLRLSVAFNLFTLFTCLLAPLSLWLAARMFRFSGREQLTALALGVLVWHMDTAASAWRGGMISFCMVSHGSIAVLGLFWRMLHPDQLRRWPLLLALLLLLPLNLLTHVWSFAILALPLTALYLWRWRRRELRLADHLQVWGLALFALMANMHWLYPALRHYDLIAPSGVVGQANPLYLISDWFGLLVNPLSTGFNIPHTLFRFAAMCGAALTIWRWRTQHDDRAFPAMLTLAYLFGMAYVAALLPVLKETEPYRFVLPGSLLACLFGAPWWASVLSLRKFRALSRPVQATIVVLLILLFPRVVEHVTYFIPELSPEARLPPIVVNHAAGAPTSTLPTERKDPNWLPRTWRLRGVADNMMNIANFVRTRCTEPGRVLVQHWAVAEFLGWATDRPIIGGFPDRRLVHEAANLLRRPTDPRFHGKQLAEYLARYNIRYVIMTDPVPSIEQRRDLMAPMQLDMSLFPHRIYRVGHTASYVARGSGRVRADLNRIEVTDARPAAGTQAMLLRFHHMRELRCSPNCTVIRTPIPYDPVGFITVAGKPRLPSRFVIQMHYD